MSTEEEMLFKDDVPFWTCAGQMRRERSSEEGWVASKELGHPPTVRRRSVFGTMLCSPGHVRHARGRFASAGKYSPRHMYNSVRLSRRTTVPAVVTDRPNHPNMGLPPEVVPGGLPLILMQYNQVSLLCQNY